MSPLAPLLYLGAGVALLFAVFAVCIRYLLIRLANPSIEALYFDEDWNMTPAVLSDLVNMRKKRGKAFELDTGYSGLNWQFSWESTGMPRAFLLVHTHYLLENAAKRLAKHWRRIFVLLHMCGFVPLYLLVMLKTLIKPNEKDLLMLIGFDSIAADWLLRTAKLPVGQEAEAS